MTGVNWNIYIPFSPFVSAHALPRRRLPAVEGPFLKPQESP